MLVLSAERAVFLAVMSDTVLMKGCFGVELKALGGLGAVETEDVVFGVVFVMLPLALGGKGEFAFGARPSTISIGLVPGFLLFAVHGGSIRFDLPTCRFCSDTRLKAKENSKTFVFSATVIDLLPSQNEALHFIPS